MTITVSTQPTSSESACSACCWRRLPSNGERLGDHGNGERAEFAGERSDHGSRAAAGAAAEAGGQENHVRAFEGFDDLVGILERRLAANLGIGARAEALGEFSADLQLDGRLRELQRLQVGVRGDELDAFDLGADHAVDGVASSAAHADHFDLRALLIFFAKRNPDSRVFRRHIRPSAKKVALPRRSLFHYAPANMLLIFATKFAGRWGAWRRARAP